MSWVSVDFAAAALAGAQLPGIASAASRDPGLGGFIAPANAVAAAAQLISGGPSPRAPSRD